MTTAQTCADERSLFIVSFWWSVFTSIAVPFNDFYAPQLVTRAGFSICNLCFVYFCAECGPLQLCLWLATTLDGGEFFLSHDNFPLFYFCYAKLSTTRRQLLWTNYVKHVIWWSLFFSIRHSSPLFKLYASFVAWMLR